MKNNFTIKLILSLLACVMFVGMSRTNAQTYCTPTYTNSCTSGDDINNVILAGDVAPGINNLNTPCNTGNYTDYTTMSAALTAGQSYSGNVTTNYGSPYENVRIWIDYDNDGVFQPTEQIATLADMSNASSGAFTFIVPVAQAAGTFRMRVRLVYSQSPGSIDPCTNYGYGETQDYNVIITAATPCTAMPSAGTLPATMGVCANIPFSISVTSPSIQSGLVTQWQRRVPAGTGTWTDIAGATLYSYNSTGITVPTDYRFISTCTASGLSDTTTTLAVTLNPANQCYCIPVTTNSSYFIDTFRTTLGITNVSNLGSGYSTGGYGDFSATQGASQYITNSFNFYCKMIGTSTYGIKVWVDWNQNGNFTDAGEEVFVSSAYANSFTGPITVPATATPGVTRMRVGANLSSSTGPVTSCTDFASGEYEDYQFTVVPLPLCDTVTFPTTVAIGVDHDTVCVSQDIQLSLETVLPPASGLTYQYQSSASAAGPWTDIGTPQVSSTLTITNVNTPTFYRLLILCSGTVISTTTSNILPVIISDPQVLTSTPGTRCGPGTVELSGTASANSELKWYAAATGGLAMGTGNTFTTPYITQTTTYYVGAGVGGAALPPTFIGTGTASTSGNPSPFYNLYDGNRTQYLFTAAELTAAGFTAGVITGIGFDVVGTGNALQDFNISIGTTTLNTLSTATWVSGLTQVYTTPSFSPVVNSVNAFTFSTPFAWDGVSNLIIQTCYYNGSWGGTYATVKYTTGLSFNATHYLNQDANSAICSTTSPSAGSVLTSRPNIQFTIISGCESPRTPVVASVTPGPILTLNYDSVVCNNTARPIAVSSPVGNYSSYVWTPTTDLYTNAAGTTPYTGGSASTVYFKSGTSGMHTYSLAATNGPLQTDCAAADTLNIWVQPNTTGIHAQPDTICVSGTTDLKLIPDTNYFSGTIQWQESATGVTYANVTGANMPAYTTPTLTSEHYYKAIISAQAGVCESPIKHISISNPQVVSVQDSFNCGPGTVTLAAVAGANSSLKWYEHPTGGLSVGSGSSYTTPYLLETDTFYVSAGVGGGAIPPTFIGTGTPSTSSNPSPFYNLYDGNRSQYLFTAAELTAAGFTAGVITGIGFDVVSTGNALQDFNISIGTTTLNTLSTATWVSGLTQVYTTASFLPIANSVNDLTLSTPFVWDGASNLIVQTCYYNGSWGGTYAALKYTTGLSFNATHYLNQDANSAICSTTSPAAGSVLTSRPNIQFTMVAGCESPRQAVIAYIRPIPSVNLGNDFNVCVDSGASYTLDAGTFPNNPSYLWDNNTTNQTRGVNTSGSYRVAVTNSYGCVGRDTVNITLRNNPVVDLGSDTTVCEGIILTLNAGDDGISYFWNTGETANEIDVDHAGTYTVIVTNSIGCTKTDTIDVVMSGHIPTIAGIQVTNTAPQTFSFNAVSPQNAVSYDWDFGDGEHSDLANPSHSYPTSGNYLVKLKILGTCGFLIDSTYIHIVGIGEVKVDNSEMTIYPNPTTGQATIVNNGDLKMESIEVLNVLGQRVYKQKADSPQRHEISLGGIASGLYTVHILTDKGNVTRKLEIVR